MMPFGPDGIFGKDRPIRVTDDWPEVVPITDAELRVMGGHFAEELDAILGPRA